MSQEAPPVPTQARILRWLAAGFALGALLALLLSKGHRLACGAKPCEFLSDPPGWRVPVVVGCLIACGVLFAVAWWISNTAEE